MQNKLVIGIVLGIVATIGTIVVVSCQHRPITPESPKPLVEGVKTDLQNIGKSLDQTTHTIQDNATQGQRKTPPALMPTLNPHWTGILSAAGQQVELVRQIEQKDRQLGEALTKIGEQDTELTKRGEKITKLEASLTDALRKRMHLLVVVGVIGIAVSCALFFSGNKVAIYTGVGSAALTGVALVIGQTAQLLPWLVGGASLAAIGVGVYAYLQHRKRNEQLNGINHDLVRTVEVTKSFLPVASRREVFGDGAKPGLMGMVQSRDTQDWVWTVRQDLKARNQITPSVPARIAADLDQLDLTVVEAEEPQPEPNPFGLHSKK